MSKYRTGRKEKRAEIERKEGTYRTGRKGKCTNGTKLRNGQNRKEK